MSPCQTCSRTQMIILWQVHTFRAQCRVIGWCEHCTAQVNRRSELFCNLSPSGCVRYGERKEFPSRVHHLLLASHFSLDTHTAYPWTKVHACGSHQPDWLHLMLECIVMVSCLKEILITHKNEPSVALVWHSLINVKPLQSLHHTLRTQNLTGGQ